MKLLIIKNGIGGVDTSSLHETLAQAKDELLKVYRPWGIDAEIRDVGEVCDEWKKGRWEVGGEMH